ncbi:MAG: methyltransferase domain-containing protein, partial [Panacagrimonas sp.]
MLDYYAQRAGEYEQIYGKPERQADLNVLRSHLIEQVRGQRVLELACGTAYWTEVMSQSAEFVLATDLSPEVLEVAMAKNLPPTTVAFAQADAWNVPRFAGEFSLAFAGFWWSHVPLQSLDGFLGSLRLSLGGGTRAVFIDNRYVHGSS